MPPKPRQLPEAKSVQWREWKGLNVTDARTAIKDDETSWQENAIVIGSGAIQILNGPGAAIATVANGITSWGMTLNGLAITLVIGSDGSITQVTIPGGVKTAVAPAGTVSSSARVFGPWQGTTALIIDPTFGYMSWDGTSFVVIDAARIGVTAAVFEGRVWISRNRTTVYTAPLSYNDFTAANGGGSFVLTDEAFPGNIIDLHSALEQLWITGQGAIDAVSNVVASGVAPSVVTTFSVTNIVGDLGTNSAASIRGYLRSLGLNTAFGVYALSGVTPQKISEKLDGLYPDITIGNSPAAVAVVQSLLCLMFLVTYNGTKAQAGAGPTPMLIVFSQGKWCMAAQGTTLIWITTVSVSGVAQCWGLNTAGGVFQLFGASNATAVAYKVQSKLFDFGSIPLWKRLLKAGFEVQASNAINPTFTVDSEANSRTVAITFQNIVNWINASGGLVQFQNSLGQNVFFYAIGLAISWRDAPLAGHYLGWTIAGNDPPYRIGAVFMQYQPSPPEEWVQGPNT